MDGRTLHLILEELGRFFSDETERGRDYAEKPFGTLNKIAASVYNTEDDDERKQHREEAVKSYSSQIIEVCHELEDAVDNYATKVSKPHYLKASYLFKGTALQSSFRTTIQALQKELEKTFKDLDKKLREQKVEKDEDGPQTKLDTAAYSSVDKKMVIGRKGDLDAILKKLSGTQEPEDHVRVIPIIGIAGIGKTTLARLIFEDKEVVDRFGIRVWVPISDDFSVIKILKAIIKSSTGTATLANRLHAVVTQFRKLKFGGKQLLIVMDDVQNADDASWRILLEHLGSLKTKITILVTTRFKEVASRLGSSDSTHQLKELSTEECWQLLSTIALSHASAYEKKELEDTGRQIVIKCNGLPLAAKHLGDYLQSRNTKAEWLNVLNREISDLDDFDKGFFPSFGLPNPNNLPPATVSKQDKTETLPFIDHEVFGRKKELKGLLDKLLPNDQHEKGHVHVIPIVGMAGIGKTTLAQSIYNDQMAESHFDLRLWVCVSDDFGVKRILKQMTEDLTGTAATSDLEDILIRSLQDQIKGKRLLLVLDDVRTEDYKQSWEELKGHLSAVAQGTTVLATTRTENVVKMMAANDQRFPLDKLEEEDCRKLFGAIAFSGRTDEEIKILEEIGRKIVAKCNGLPVAVKTLGGYMRFKKTRDEWQKVLDSETSSLGGTEEDLLQIFESSFNHLQPNLKLCLLYCAVFPKDHLIETDTLIKLWMALGYLGSNIPGQVEGSNEDTEKEKLGLEYLKELQMHSFLQDFKMGVDTCSMTCKINGVVHKFLSAIPMRECVTMKVDHLKGAKVESSVEEPKVESSVENPKVESSVEKPKVESPVEKPRHLSLEVARSLFPDSVTKVEKLRSLLVWSHYAIVTTACLRDLFQRLRWVRALCFSCCSITKIPCEIGNLNLLRYLNLSYNRNLKELPKEVCDLYNLQTLNLNGCDSLEKLPQGMGKLTNLRHLEILWTKSLGFLPKGVGELRSLLTLNRFVINRGSDHNKACNLGDLQNLNKLTWYLGIEGLGNVTNVDEGLAGKEILKNKEGLAGLDLWFSGVQVEESIPYNLLDALEPPSDLRYLGVHYYGGIKFPDWMASLAKLRELILFGCRKCTNLPCLAELPLLESYEIWEMEIVTEIGLDVPETKSVNMPFPKLESLCIHNMRQWEDWQNSSREKADIAMMPSLKSLTIEGCPKIKSLPCYLQNSKELRELSISGCPNLKQSCQMKTGEDWGKISHIPNIKIDGEVVKGDGHPVSDSSSSSSKFVRQFTRLRSQNVKD